ncbi:MAG: FtsW/RodA/SpoVE family cell cycle protein [Candidatus Merdivicinus sp.]
MTGSNTRRVSNSRTPVRKRPQSRRMRLDFSAFQAKDDPHEELPARGRMDISFFFLIIVLQTIGLIMLFSASYVTALQEEGNSLHYVIRQTAYAVVGLIAMMIASYIDYHIWRKFKWLIYIVGMGCMVWALAFEGVAGAKRWVYLAGFSFQPSEIMKFSIAILCAHLIAVNYKRMNKAKYGFWPFWIVMGPVLLLMVAQRHLSGLILIGLIGCTMMFIGGSKLRWFFGLAAVGAVLLFLGILVMGGLGKFAYVGTRLENWLHPLEGDIRDGKWQTAQGLYAIGSGGLFGVGLGNSTQKHLYVSEPQNDMIFSIVCEELGFVGAMIIILLFVLLVYSGFSIAMRAPDKFGCMLAIGLTAQVGWQALLNIAVVTNSMPNTGISLPFFSSGGTALTMLLAQMGVILNISRYARKPEPRTKEIPQDKSDDKA